VEARGERAGRAGDRRGAERPLRLRDDDSDLGGAMEPAPRTTSGWRSAIQTRVPPSADAATGSARQRSSIVDPFTAVTYPIRPPSS